MTAKGITRLSAALTVLWLGTSAAGFGRSPAASHVAADSVKVLCQELLGRPTSTSVALNFCIDTDGEALVEYGRSPAAYEQSTPVVALTAGTPATITIAPLIPDSRYFYRVRYRGTDAAEFQARSEHSFQTARPRGRPFTFAIEADPHLDTSTHPTLYRRTLGNILQSGADFLLDLGDNFMSDKLPVKSRDSVLARHLLLRSFYDDLGHSVPLMLVLGNHEGELGWLLNGTVDNLAVWASTIRTTYYPNPLPGEFYSGDTTRPGFLGERQNFYAWEWGDALFVVLDPYWYTARKPGQSHDNWDWTLGSPQYEWFARTLSQSSAPFKFVFAHQIVGGIDFEGRGGIEAVPFYEMGGLNPDSTWGFSAHRPGWPKPLHQLMVEHGVNAFFHGHDHVYVRQELDGVVYHELPQPAYFNFNNPEKSYTNVGMAAAYGYTHGEFLPSSGYLRVTVSDSSATVDYVRSYLPEHENASRRNGEVAASYVMKSRRTATSVGAADLVPVGLSLQQNYPNPFNARTTVSYRLDRPTAISLDVFDLLGRKIATLAHGPQDPGQHQAYWDASGASSGLYVCRLTDGTRVRTTIMSLLK